jgi:mRNA-degrading endonuclease toxin of MazEF toxin-antitoxin module
MKSRRGDVVIIDHPFSDATGSKVRPALIVQTDARNSRLTETIIALITKNTNLVATDPTQLLIDLKTPDGRASGLHVNSAVKCGKLFTVHENLIRNRIGLLTPMLMQKIDACLKVALALS